MSAETDELIQEFVAEGGDFRDWRPGYNIRPTDTVAAVIQSAKGSGVAVRRLEPARWSLTPPWSKTLKTAYPTFNARAEGITEKATWRGAVRQHRSLVIASGYYEWQTDSVSKVKTPYYLHSGDGQLLAFAGLYSWWRNPALADDDPLRWSLTTTILTSDAVDELLHIHDRNPVPLPREFWDRWLDPTVVGDQFLVDAAVEAALPVAERLAVQRVAPIAHNGDGPALIESIA